VGIEVRLLGGFSATVDGERVPEHAWRLRKARTLVKLLSLASRRTLHRGQLIDHLWPEHEPHRAANNLDQAVHAARRALGGDQGPRRAPDTVGRVRDRHRCVRGGRRCRTDSRNR
jgi:DNA-binding SARP family transcriptional activator